MKTNTILFSLFLAIALLVINCKVQIVFSQSPNWQWVKSAGDSIDEYANSVTTDASGNIYVTGNFLSPTIVFGNDTLINADSSGWSPDMFFVKYDASGNVLWAKSAGGGNSDNGNHVTTDVNGNVYVTGDFSSNSITFGSVTLINTYTSSSNWVQDIFLVKYDSNGNVLWAKGAEGAWRDYSHSVTTDDSGNVYITGEFDGNSIIFGNDTLILAGWQDIFIAKYDENGNVLWAKSGKGGNSNSNSFSVATDASNNVYITGDFGGTITFGSISLTYAGYSDFFLVKYDSNGNVIWAKKAGGGNFDIGFCAATDANGDVYVTGLFASSSITFGSITLTKVGIWNNMFLVKYDSNGNVLWAKKPGQNYNDYGSSVATDANGNAYVTGHFVSSIILGLDTLTGNGGAEVFIAKYDANGNTIWAKSAGGSKNDSGRGVTIDANGNIYVAGEFGSTSMYFDNDSLVNAGGNTNNCSSSSGCKDMFIAKLDTSSTSGIANENSFFIVINIYPNPFSTQANLVLPQEVNINESPQLIVYDMYGNETTRVQITSYRALIARDNLASGMYFCKVLANNAVVATGKFIIQ